MPKTPKKIQIVSALLGIVALTAVGWYTFEAFNSGLSLSQLRLNWLIGAFALHVAVVAALPIIWIRMLALVRSSTDRPVNMSDPALYHAYGRSWLARYIPGRVWMVGGRVIYGKQAGISTRSTSASTLLEAGLSYSALGLLGISLLVGSWVHWSVAVVLAAAAFAVTLVTLRAVFSGTKGTVASSRFANLLRKSSDWLTGDEKPSTKTLLLTLLAFWLHAAVQLVFFVMVALAVEDLAASDFMLLAGAWGIGASIGYISFFSAGGLGVRDGIAFAFVGPALTGPVAATVVAVSRIILVVVDLALVGAVEVVGIMLKRRNAHLRRTELQIESRPVDVILRKGS